jgi:hypothetical protein
VKVTVNRSASILVPFFLIIWAAACQPKTELKVGNANSATTNTATQNTASGNQSEGAKTAENSSAEVGSLATPTEAYKAGYTARQKKDIAGLKRVLSKEALQFLTDVGKDEQKTLDDQLKALSERPQAPTAESRNEKITGDTATLEYLNEKGQWSTMHFVKEGNDWKITLPKTE